jgi:serine/threonine protein kinase
MLKKDALKEVEEYTMIDRADKNSQYYTGNPIHCKIKRTPQTERAIRKCSLTRKKTMDKVLSENSLLIIGDGGYDLEKWVKKVLKSKNPQQQISDFWREMTRMTDGLVVFKKYDLIHHDLKPQNIVFRPETKRSNFIDFGLMRSIRSEAAKCREVASCRGSSHWNYPTEIIFMNKKYFMMVSKNSDSQRNIIYKQFMDNIKKRSQTDFGNAFDIMISYIFKRDDIEKRKAFTDRYMNAWRDLLMSIQPNSIQPNNYEDFLTKTIYGFDVFGFGLSMMYVLSRLQQFMKPEIVTKMDDLFFRMMTPNVFVRITAEQARDEYKMIVAGI